MTLTELDAELIARGFAGFSPAQRTRYINWGYFQVARASRWWWEKDSEDLAFAVGDFRKALAATFDSSLKAVVTSPNDRRRALKPLSEQDFLENWYPLDLAGTGGRGDSTQYFIWAEEAIQYLYLIPPPDAAMTVHHIFSQEVVPLAAGGDSLITPDEMDEAVVLAALIRCHMRANEQELAMTARGMLEEAFDLQLNVDGLKMDEEVERVEPYPWP
jgi:hypothetical protein